MPKPAGEGRPDPNQRGLEAVPRRKPRCAEAALLPRPCCLLQQRAHLVQQFLESCWSQAGSRCPWNSRAVAWPVLLQAIESSGCVMARSTRSGRGELVLPLPAVWNTQFWECFSLLLRWDLPASAPQPFSPEKSLLPGTLAPFLSSLEVSEGLFPII